MKLLQVSVICLLATSAGLRAEQSGSELLDGHLGAAIQPSILSKAFVLQSNQSVLDIPSHFTDTDSNIATQSFALSIVNMPVSLVTSTNVQRTNPYQSVLSSHLVPYQGQNQFDDERVNLDMGIKISPLQGLSFGVTAQNILPATLSAMDYQGELMHYQSQPQYRLSVAYDMSSFLLSSDLEMLALPHYQEGNEIQIWHVGGALKATDWLAVRVGYQKDLMNNNVDIYSLGTDITLGRVFNVDLTGLYGSDDAIGALIRTSYHF